MPEVYDKVRGHFEDSSYAPTRQQAVRKIESREYDRVLTDYHLGDDDPQGGLEVARAAIEKGLPVILMSRENQEEEARKLGIRFVFKKSVIQNGWPDSAR